MIILYSKKINQNLPEILNLYQNTYNYSSLVCPCCQSNSLIKWGSYSRTAIYISNNKIEQKTICIQRYRCKSCLKTHGLLPSGLIPYRQYSTDIISFALLNFNDNTFSSIINYVSYETIKKWQKQYNKFHPLLVTMLCIHSKSKILSYIYNNFICFFKDFFNNYHFCFMQIKMLFLNMCPL